VKRVKWALAIAGVAAAVIAAFMIWGRNSEPRWKGRPLSYWILQDTSRRSDVIDIAEAHRREVLVGIGPQAIRYLGNWIGSESPKWRLFLMQHKLSGSRLSNYIPMWLTTSYVDLRHAAAAEALTSLRSGDTWAIPELRTLVKSTNRAVWSVALETLGHIGPASVPALAEILSNRYSPARWETLPWLDQFGSNAALAIPALIACCEEGPLPARSAAPVLERVQAETRVIVRAWVLALGEPRTMPLPLAAPPKLVFERLASYGTNAAPAVPGLVNWLESKNGYNAEAAAFALGEIRVRPNIGVPALTWAVTNVDSACRYAAVDALGSFGPDARTAVPILVACLKDPWVASVTARSLGQIRCEAATVVPALVDTLGVAERSGWPLPLGEWTADALGQFGPAAQTAVPVLMKCLDQEKAPVFEAARALRRIQAEPELVVSALTNSLAGSPGLRNKALLGLGEFKDISPVALGAITNALADPDLFVRAGAETALKSRREELTANPH
jgi:HEAT repeat protein